MNSVLVFCVAFATVFTIAAPQNHPVAVSEVHELYVQDQRDRGVGNTPAISGAQLSTRDQQRRTRVHQMLEAGLLKTAGDFHDAAFIYQHGQTPDDYLLAHVLATVAVAKGDKRSLWISAATLDRYLTAIHQPQIFGTQYHSTDDLPLTQEPYQRRLIPDRLRGILCVPSLQQQKINLAEFAAGKYPEHIMPEGCTR